MRRRGVDLACSFAFVWISLVSHADAEALTPVRELLAQDARPSDALGWSSALSGGKAFIAAAPDLVSLDGAPGAVYVFDNATGVQLAKLQSPEVKSRDCFGESLSVSGMTAVVGAFWTDFDGINAGSAFVFDLNTNTQVRHLRAPGGAAGDAFGVSVANNDRYIVVGASMVDDDGMTDAGSVYVYDATGTHFDRRLTSPNPRAKERFGRSVAISGSMLLVGAPENDRGGVAAGAAYLMELETGRSLELRSPTPSVLDQFGWSGAIDGNYAIVGAPFDEVGAVSGTGAAYVFDAKTGQLLHTLVADDAVHSMYFGYSVAISGRLAVVGACQDGRLTPNAGAAYVYDILTGEQLAKLTAPSPMASDLFGTDVAISGSTVLVTAIDRDVAGTNAGAAYVFVVPEPSAAALCGCFLMVGCLLRRSSFGPRRFGG